MFMNSGSRIEEALKGYSPIFLKEMGKAGLMSRKDSKYVFSLDILPVLLEAVKKDYRVLEIEGECCQLYRTTYYDTEKLDMYHLHHRGRASRHKVRFRNYATSGQTYLEVKHKNSKRITNKKRMETGGSDMKINGSEAGFLLEHIPYGPKELQPALDNSFRRITLVSPGQNERITLDYGLDFSNRRKDGEEQLPGVAIAEIKYIGHLTVSPFHLALRKAKVYPKRISKYCVGMALLNSDLKQNLFKSKLRSIIQINQKAI